MIKAILWDNDGVLVDTEHVYFEATQHVLASVGMRAFSYVCSADP